MWVVRSTRLIENPEENAAKQQSISALRWHLSVAYSSSHMAWLNVPGFFSFALSSFRSDVSTNFPFDEMKYVDMKVIDWGTKDWRSRYISSHIFFFSFFSSYQNSIKSDCVLYCALLCMSRYICRYIFRI